jgi:glycosyltransferase involved in cell wall biosynthesis
MKIAFFGTHLSFDYFKIGGVESFGRRLATTLVKKGHQADFLVYGGPTSRSQTVGPGINFQEGCAALRKNYEHVLTMHLLAPDRLRYLSFRQRNCHRLRFHKIYFSWTDSPIRRQAEFLDARLLPYNGRLFCISRRQFDYVSRWSDRAVLLLPPVSEPYFIPPENKPNHDKLKITYIGRTESAKGVEEVINLFTKLMNSSVRTEIHGFHHGSQKSSVQIHEWLKVQKDISYFHTPFEGYSEEMEDNLIRTLKDTDILLLPYVKLSSTIDSPMLLLEGMASLCTVIAPAEGSIPFIYGSSPFLYDDNQDLADIVNWAQASPRHLADERKRIFQRNTDLDFRAPRVAARLLEAMA